MRYIEKKGWDFWSPWYMIAVFVIIALIAVH